MSTEREEITLASAENQPEVSTEITNSKEILNPYEDDEEPLENYAGYQKEDFLKLVKDLSESNNFKKIGGILREIKPLFDELVNNEKELALQKFQADGGAVEDFKFKEDATTKQFYTLFNKIQKQRYEQLAELEKQKDANLVAKKAILDKIRTIVTGEETKDSLTEVRKLQKEFKTIGAVPNTEARELWESYRALLDQFYNKQSLFNELKDLDRRKNLEQKVLICEKAEILINTENIRKAIKDLNELHEEFKHIGPVPKEEQENIWNRFKAASDKLYDKKRELQKIEEEEKQKNLALKEELYQKVLPYVDFTSDKITEWNTKTKELLEIQKQWDAIRFIPKEAAKEASRKFWTSFKAFFNHKNAFIHTLDQEREKNLAKKTALCEKAEALLNANQDKNETAEALKVLQREWKEIGTVPQKFQQSIYERFKKACDTFFEKIRSEYDAQEKIYEENLKLKKDLCEKVANYTAKEGENYEEKLQEFVKEWRMIGFVPRKHKDSIQEKFDKVLLETVKKLPLNDDEKEKVQISVELAMFGESVGSQKRIQERVSTLRRKIQKMETDVDTLRNNMGFLAKSNKADKLRTEIQRQIYEAEGKINQLKHQLKLYTTLEAKK
jgi:hypothetical protein